MIAHLLAHAGHGHTEGQSLLHYLVEPAHLPFTLATAAVVAGLIIWRVRRRRQA